MSASSYRTMSRIRDVPRSSRNDMLIIRDPGFKSLAKQGFSGACRGQPMHIILSGSVQLLVLGLRLRVNCSSNVGLSSVRKVDLKGSQKVKKGYIDCFSARDFGNGTTQFPTRGGMESRVAPVGILGKTIAGLGLELEGI